eukprot:5427933-Ditylum_brightwellii.AAC.1
MSTMLPNKRSMCLETIGALFLFQCSDVSEGSGLALSRSSSTFKGCQASLLDFQESLKKGSSSCGP